MLARVRALMELTSARDALARQNVALDAEVHRRMAKNDPIKNFSLNALATLAEKRDNETGNHLRRTHAYIEALITHLRDHPRFSADLADPQARQRIAKAAPLHDICKVGIPDAILFKPDKLTAEEFVIMKTHASIGAEAIGDVIRNVRAARLQSHNARNAAQTAQSLDFLETTRQIAGGHNEKWCGSGHPEGIAGDAIPLAGRLMALADVFDALKSKRHYQAAFTLADAVDSICQGRGQHFDPDITDAFLALTDTFTDITNRFADFPPNPSE